ncbi:MAG: putative lipid II flippase FtsW [Candidatus Margulisiibacteriota bacterium]
MKTRTKNQPDFLLFVPFGLLLIVGLVMMFSASPSMALKSGDAFFFVKRHIIYILFGLFALNFGMNVDLEKLKKLAFPFLIISFALLAIVFLPGVGRTMGGASRWIDLHFISFQPGEIARFALVLFLAASLSNNPGRITDLFRGFLPPMLVVGIMSAMLLMQPDMGTVVSIILISFAMLFVAGARLLHLGVVSSLAAAGIIVLSFITPYRFRRLTAFANPWKDPQGAGFHIIQSLLAVGSGGFWGVGLGASKQKFQYLPQQYADFIFAVYCEELGFVGAIILIGLYLFFFGRALKIARGASTLFENFLAVGIIFLLAVQVFTNLAVVLALLPTTGIPLPFISYGGTSMIINLFSVGLLLNISKRGSDKA